MSNIEQVQQEHPTKQQLYGHLQPITKLSKLDEPDIRDTAGEVRTWAIYSCGPLYMDKQRQDNQLETIYNSSVPIQDIALKTSRER